MARKSQIYDSAIKILLIGDSGVGKSSMLMRFCDDSFDSNFVATIGIDFQIKTINIDGRKLKLQIWDTAGQERFRTLTNAYYRGAMGIVLVYDVTDEQSFQNIQGWLSNIERFAPEQVDQVLVGNKCELTSTKVVEHSRGQAFASEHSMKFFETSARANVNVVEVFTTLAQDIKNRQASDPKHARTGIIDVKSTKPRACC